MPTQKKQKNIHKTSSPKKATKSSSIKKKKKVSVNSTKRPSSKKNTHVARIKVVGIGGGGGNALTRMNDHFPRSVEMIAINTDLQDLEQTQARKKIYIGKQLTKGLGAGMDPELGMRAAEESRDDIAESLKGADIVFLTAGFGGGTGSGATPVVAEIAQELGILTVAVVTKPFSFEGSQRATIAQDALGRLKDRVDAYITVSNDKIFSVINKETSLKKAFEAIDDVLQNAVLGVTEIIITPGIINVDFADVRAIMQGAGPSIIGLGVGSGKERGIMAANVALNSPLLETTVDGAKGVLFSVSGHKDITMSEINDIAQSIAENADPSARIIFGTYHDRKLSKGKIKVTLIATGFGSSYGRNVSLFGESSFSQTTLFGDDGNDEGEDTYTPEEQQEESTPVLTKDAEETNEEELWDIPAFLRKKKGKKGK